MVTLKKEILSKILKNKNFLSNAKVSVFMVCSMLALANGAGTVVDHSTHCLSPGTTADNGRVILKHLLDVIAAFLLTLAVESS
jgi:hypothetical protein